MARNMQRLLGRTSWKSFLFYSGGLGCWPVAIVNDKKVYCWLESRTNFEEVGIFPLDWLFKSGAANCITDCSSFATLVMLGSFPDFWSGLGFPRSILGTLASTNAVITYRLQLRHSPHPSLSNSITLRNREQTVNPCVPWPKPPLSAIWA